MQARELMRRDVATARPEEGLDRVVQRMRTRECGCLPVVEHGKPIGMLTDRDAVMAALRTGRPLSEMIVREAMTRVVHACGPDDTIGEAERRMGLHQVRRLFVVDEEGALVGLLCLDDVAREAWRETGLVAPPVDAAGVGRTLGEIGRPHLTSLSSPGPSRPVESAS